MTSGKLLYLRTISTNKSEQSDRDIKDLVKSMTDRRSQSLSISDTRTRAQTNKGRYVDCFEIPCLVTWPRSGLDVFDKWYMKEQVFWGPSTITTGSCCYVVLFGRAGYLAWASMLGNSSGGASSWGDYLTRTNEQGSEFQYGTQWSTVRCSSLNQNQFTMCDSFRDPLFRVLEFTLFFVRYDHILCYYCA